MSAPERYGDPIPDSSLHRAWCTYCGNPMRILASDVDHSHPVHCCTDCQPPLPRFTGLTERQRVKLKMTTS